MNIQVAKTQENKNQPVANAFVQKKRSRTAVFQFANHWPETILQRKMQDMADKSQQVAQSKVIQEMAKKSLTNTHPVQRYVSVTSDNKDSGADYVTLNSIAFAKQIAGGEVENFNASDFSAINEGEKIAFVGHGGQGSSGRYKGTEIGNKLIDGTEGMPDGNHDITFTSCNAGKRTNEETLNSVVDQVKGKIVSKWHDSTSKVKGAVGPSVKTLSSGGEEQWGVVDPDKVGLAGQVQGMLNEIYGLTITNKPDLEGGMGAKASAVQENQRPYFLDFIHIINGNFSKASGPARAKLVSTGLIYKLFGGLSATQPLREV